MSAHEIALTVNGEELRESVDARTTLVDFLRDTLGLTGSPPAGDGRARGFA